MPSVFCRENPTPPPPLAQPPQLLLTGRGGFGAHARFRHAHRLGHLWQHSLYCRADTPRSKIPSMAAQTNSEFDTCLFGRTAGRPQPPSAWTWSSPFSHSCERSSSCSPRGVKRRGDLVAPYRTSSTRARAPAEPVVKRRQVQPLAPRKIQINSIIS
jgi:hypothetical protein